MSDQWLVEELHTPVIIKLKKRKVKSSFIDNILEYWACWYVINK